MSNIKDRWFDEDDWTPKAGPSKDGRNNHWGYLAPKLREDYVKKLADKVVSNMRNDQILQYTPQYLGPDVTEAHRDFVRNQARAELNRLDDYTLSRRWVDNMEPNGVEADSFRNGGYAGRKDLLN